MTLDQLQATVKSYVIAAKQAGTFSASSDSITKLVDKIAKTITIDGSFQDKLPQLDGEKLEYGKTIEEYFIDLAEVSAESASPTTDALAVHRPTFEASAYSYGLGKQVIKTTVDYDLYEKGVKNAEECATITNMVLKRLYDSYAMFKYNAKKQMLSNLCYKVEQLAVPQLYTREAMPTTAATGEAFIKEVKEQVENAEFANKGNCLAGANATIGASEGLILIVKKGVRPVLDTQVMAGAFNPDKLAVPAEIVVVDDIPTSCISSGTTSANLAKAPWAILIDKRALRLYPSYMAVREQLNGSGDYVNYFLHTDNTAFISKYAFVHIWELA